VTPKRNAAAASSQILLAGLGKMAKLVGVGRYRRRGGSHRDRFVVLKECIYMRRIPYSCRRVPPHPPV
jgi:hypothetical protein